MVKRQSLVVLSAVGTLVVGVAAGVLLGRTALAPDAVAKVGHGALCNHYGEDQIRALLPSTPYVTSSWIENPSMAPGTTRADCSVNVKGGSVFVENVTVGETASEWKASFPGDNGVTAKTGKAFKAGDTAIAWQNTAGAYVSCPAYKTNFEVTVDTRGTASGTGAGHMRTVEALTRAFADLDVPPGCHGD